MAETLENHESSGNNGSETTREPFRTNPIAFETSPTSSRIRIAMLEHERNIQAHRMAELVDRVRVLERSLEQQQERRQQIVDQYERIISEKDRLAAR